MKYFSTICSLLNMLTEMNRKNLEIKRITKTASLLLMSGLTPNSISCDIIEKVLCQQQQNGGWVSIVDTMWNTSFLQLLSDKKFKVNINAGKEYLKNNKNELGLWGRSKRDISRIPVTGMLLFLFDDLNIKNEIANLECLWNSELNSIVYKAAYTLMAFKKNDYIPQHCNIIENTCTWLIDNQRDDGGFAPWIEHPVDSNVFCTAISILGLLQYPQFVPKKVFEKAYSWLINNRLNSGVWKYHEIEDGTSWGLYSLVKLDEYLEVSND